MRLQLHMYTQEGPSHLLLKYDEQFEDCLGILYGFIKAIKREVVTKLFSSIFVHSFSQFGGVLF